MAASLDCIGRGAKSSRAFGVEAEARLLRTRSELEEHRAELEFAEYEHQRISTLHDGRVASDRETEDAKRLIGVAQARVEAALRAVAEGEREVELLSIRLEDMTVRAPYDARVVERHVDAGEWIEPGESIVTLVSTGTIEARLEVPERYAEPVARHADRIYVEVAGMGQTLPSTEVRVIPDVDPRARTFRVVLTLDNGEGALSPGMSVSAWIPTTEESERLTLPKNAIIRSGREAYVFRTAADDEGRTVAAQTPVSVLFDWGDRVAVSSEGLRAGDLVVTEGNERLMPGVRLALARVD